MKIYVDADACPKVIKEILYKASVRTNTYLILVANVPLTLPKYPTIKMIQVGKGFDIADDFIANQCQPGDLVITADIPLADKVIDQKGAALNPRGQMYTQENIKQRLSLRNFCDELRSSGVHTGGPKVMSQREIQAFANELDRYLTQFLQTDKSLR